MEWSRKRFIDFSDGDFQFFSLYGSNNSVPVHKKMTGSDLNEKPLPKKLK